VEVLMYNLLWKVLTKMERSMLIWLNYKNQCNQLRVTPETWRVTPETWRVTPETWRVTPETWRVTPETWRVTPETWRVKENKPKMNKDRPNLRKMYNQNKIQKMKTLRLLLKA
jgi:hypothetical protein